MCRNAVAVWEIQGATVKHKLSEDVGSGSQGKELTHGLNHGHGVQELRQESVSQIRGCSACNEYMLYGVQGCMA